MHLEILVEELSARKALDNLLPRLIKNEHTYRIISYQGKYNLLNRLPNTLRGYKRWIYEDMRIIILVDLDSDDCDELKKRLDDFALSAQLIPKSYETSNSQFQVLNRIAIVELESWFFGDPEAIRAAYPGVSKFEYNQKYRKPDSNIHTWEALERILQRAGYFTTGLRKIEAADSISKKMKPELNRSKSFQIFWQGISVCLNQ